MSDDARVEAAPELKMWLAIRTDLPLSYGKLATQAGHAYGGLHIAAARDRPEDFAAYLAQATPKISVRVAGEDALRRVEREAREAGIPASLVVDAGRTEIPPNTPTMCAFGPAYRDDLPKFLKRLQVLQDEDFQTDIVHVDAAVGRLTWRLPCGAVERLAGRAGAAVVVRAALLSALAKMPLPELLRNALSASDGVAPSTER